jgi:hypothetical protein
MYPADVRHGSMIEAREAERRTLTWPSPRGYGRASDDTNARFRFSGRALCRPTPARQRNPASASVSRLTATAFQSSHARACPVSPGTSPISVDGDAECGRQVADLRRFLTMARGEANGGAPSGSSSGQLGPSTPMAEFSAECPAARLTKARYGSRLVITGAPRK